MRIPLIAAALSFICAPLVAQATDASREAEVRRVVEDFHAALASADSAAALAPLHADLVVHESGHAESLAQYRAGHLPADMRFATATTRMVTRSAVKVWGDLALYTAESRTTGRYRERDIDSHGTETMVLVRTADGWRIRHIHWSSRS